MRRGGPRVLRPSALAGAFSHHPTRDSQQYGPRLGGCRQLLVITTGSANFERRAGVDLIEAETVFVGRMRVEIAAYEDEPR